MPELRDDTTDDGFHEIQLSGKQLVFLFMATTVVMIFIFLVGVLVGRDVAVKRGDERVDSQMGAAGGDPAAELSEAAPVPVEPPSPAGEDELSYHQRLQSNAATEEVKPPPSEPQSKPRPEAPAAQASAAQAPAAGDAAGVPTSGRPGTWVLQVTALKSRANAAALVQRLVAKGYPAFLENPAAGAPVIYRVRIGRYRDRSEADQVRRRLEKEEQFDSVITR